MRLTHPIVVNGVEYRALSPRLRGSPKEWAAYDEGADVLQRLVQTASIMCDVPEAVLLELDGAADAGLGRESLYKALAPGSHPRYSTISAVMRALKVKVAVAPLAASEPKRRVSKATAKRRSIVQECA